MKKILLFFLSAVIVLSLVSCDTLDKSKLKKLVNEEIIEEEYTESTYAVYKQKFDEAKVVLEDTGTTQEKINEAAEALDAAINSLVKVANFKSLEEALAVEYPEENYTKESYQEYRAAYEAALEILGNEETRQSTVNSVLKNLKAKIEALVSMPDTAELDKLLSLKIDSVKYTASTYNKYKQLCDAAKTLKEKAATVETHNDVVDCKAEIEHCVAQIKDAIAKLVPRGDKTALLDAYEEAFAHYNGRIDGVAASVYYSSETYQAFGTALNNAKNALDSDDMTQNHLDQIIKVLKQKMEALEPSQVRIELYNFIVTIQREYIDHSEYFTTETFAVLNSAVNAAIDEYNSASSSEARMKAAMEKINNAILGLEYVMIVGTGRTDYYFPSYVLKVGTAFVGISDYFANPVEFATLLSGPDNPHIQSISGTLDSGMNIRLDDGSIVSMSRYMVIIKPADASAEGIIYDKVSIGNIDLMCNDSGVVSNIGANPTEYYAENSISTLVYTDGDNGLQIVVTYNMLKNSISKIEVSYNPFA